MQSLPVASVLSAAPQWSGVECPVEFPVMTGLFKHLPCPAPWPLTTGCYWALEMWWVWLKNWMLFSYTCRVNVCTAWLGNYFIGQCRSRLGFCCPISTPEIPAASVHMAGNRFRGLPQWLSGKEATCQCKRNERCGFNPWVKKIPSRREWLPTPGFLPGESHARRSLVSFTLSMALQRVGHDWIELACTHPASYR